MIHVDTNIQKYVMCVHACTGVQVSRGRGLFLGPVDGITKITFLH